MDDNDQYDFQWREAANECVQIFFLPKALAFISVRFNPDSSVFKSTASIKLSFLEQNLKGGNYDIRNISSSFSFISLRYKAG